MHLHGMTFILPCRSNLDFENLVWYIQCISKTIKCRMLNVGCYLVWILVQMNSFATSWCDLDLTSELAIVALNFKMPHVPCLINCKVYGVDT